MADAEIRLTADASGAKAEINSLRQVIDQAIASLGIVGAAGKQAGDILEKEFREAGVSAEEAQQALDQVVPALKEQEGATNKSTAATGRFSEEARKLRNSLDALSPGLGKNVEGLVNFAAKAFAVVKIAEGVAAAIASVGKATGVLNDEGVQAVESFQGALKKLITLDVVGFVEDLGKSVGEAIGAITEATTKAEDALGNAAKANKVAREELRDTLGVLKEINEERQKEAQEAEATAGALVRLIAQEREAGGVTKDTKDRVEDLIREYEKRGQEVPAELERERVALNILTKAEEEAGKAAEKRGEKAAQAAAKHAAALEKEVDSIEGSSKLIKERTDLFIEAVRVAEEDGKVTTQAQENIRKKLAELVAQYKEAGAEVPAELQKIIDKYGILKSESEKLAESQKELAQISQNMSALLEIENQKLREQAEAAKAAADALAEKAAQDAARAAELSGKPILNVDEVNELAELNANAAKAQFEYNEAAQEADIAVKDLNESQEEQVDLGKQVADALAKSIPLTQEQAQALGDIGDVNLEGLRGFLEEAPDGLRESSDAADDVSDAVSGIGDSAAGASDDIDELSDSVVDATDDMDALSDSAGSAAGTVEDIADAAGKIGDKAADGAKKAGGAVQGMVEDQAEYNEILAESVRLAHELASALASAAAQI